MTTEARVAASMNNLRFIMGVSSISLKVGVAFLRAAQGVLFHPMELWE
jgi:hypothetical protein